MYCVKCLTENEDGVAKCVSCGAPLEVPTPPEQHSEPAWERRASLFDLRALPPTLWDTLVRPSETFRKMVRDTNVTNPILFTVIMSLLVGAALLLRELVLPSMEMRFDLRLAPLAAVMSWLLLPFLFLLTWIISSAVVHLLLALAGARHGFSTTARVMAYTQGSAAVFSIIPVIGSFVGMVWGVVITIIGLARAHEVGIQQAATAVLAPLLFVFVAGLILG